MYVFVIVSKCETDGPGTTPVVRCSRRMPSVKGTSDLGRVIKFNVVCSLYSAWVHHHGAGARVLELHHPPQLVHLELFSRILIYCAMWGSETCCTLFFIIFYAENYYI